MFDLFKKLRYGARVLLAGKGETETIDVAGRSTVVMSGGEGPPFVYLHSSVGESVRFMGYLPDTSAAAAAADVAILASDNEGTPVALIEAAAAARPLVGTRVEASRFHRLAQAVARTRLTPRAAGKQPRVY